MPLKSRTKLIKKVPFWLITVGQSFSAAGDVFQLLAVTILLYNLTGSGLSAAFGVICTPVTSLLLSPIAGSLGDKFCEKHILILIDILRALITLLLVGKSSVTEIYIILVVQAALGNLYGPPFKKLLAGVLHTDELIAANSILTGISGIVYIIGPLTAAWFINKYRLDFSFYINSFSFVFSSLTIALIKSSLFKSSKTLKHKQGITGDIREGISYFKKEPKLKSIVIASTVICFGTAAVNMLFYPFAFNQLKVTNEQWSFMLSVFYGTNLVAMIVSNPFFKLFKGNVTRSVNSIFLMVSGVWFLYSISYSLVPVVVLQSLEGTLLGVCSILLGSFMQIYSEKRYLARVMSINDYINNLAKLAGIGVALSVIKLAGIRVSLLINSLLLLVGIVIIISYNKYVKLNE